MLPPRQIMGAEEAGKSLYDLSLLPRVAFTVQLQSDGRVTSAHAAGSELTGMLESEGSQVHGLGSSAMGGAGPRPAPAWRNAAGSC
jgi:hypothetical protein